MTNRITLIDAARLNGDSSGSYKVLVSEKLRNLGQKVGRERMLDLAEVTLLRVMTETTSGNLNLREAATRALGLFPYVKAVATSKLGGQQDHNVYAVDAWGTFEGQKRRAGYVCEGEDILSKCLNALVQGSWPNIKIMNLSEIVSETMIGWAVATNGVEKAQDTYRQILKDEPPQKQAHVWALFDEMAGRLKHSGDRRAEPPAVPRWEKWTEERMAA